MDSVRGWAAEHGHAYRFSPRFFDRAPAWFKQRCAPETGPLTDVARLYLMQELFDAGEEFVVWVDADVLVFDPSAFEIAPRSGFTVIEEVTVGEDALGREFVSPRGVNGAVLGARRSHPMFRRYFDEVENVVRNHPAGPIPRTIAGPVLLTRLTQGAAIDRLTTVGLFTPGLLAQIAAGQERLPRLFARQFGHRVAAANLCHFIRGEVPASSVDRYDAVMQAAIDCLIRSRGEVVNRHLS
jgi:hypothetical protein